VALTFTSSQILTPSSTGDVSHCAETDVIFEAPEGFRQLLLKGNFISCPSVMIRRRLYDEIGKFSLEYPYTSDCYQWMKAARHSNIAYVRDACVYYRQGEHSVSYRLLFSSPLGYLDSLKVYIQLLQDLGEERGKYAGEINSALIRFIKNCFYAGYTRADQMENFSPSLFSGIALSTWALIRPVSWVDFFRKCGVRVIIFGAGFLMHSSVMRAIVKRVLSGKAEMY